MSQISHVQTGQSFKSLLRDGPAVRDIAAERLHRKQRLAATSRLFARAGFDQGLAGHVTARDPEFTHTFWVNPLSRHFGRIRVSDLIRMDETGAVMEGDQPVNRAAFAIHSAIHTARPDVAAAAHTHSTYGKA
jgi:ribulose-5-phosphate 4-epimerase/fuculose-1-phosphate aldolase